MVTRMAKEELIDVLINYFLDTVWSSNLGRFLIRRGDITPTGKQIDKIRNSLSEILTVVYLNNSIIIPLGSLVFDLSDARTPDYGFYFIVINDENELSVAITDVKKEQGKIKLFPLTKTRGENAICWWLKDLQRKPDFIKGGIQEIEKILSEGG